MTSALGRRLWILVGAALVLTVLLVFWGGRTATAHVMVSSIAREDLSSIISTNGRVEPISPQTFRARYPTFVQRAYAVEGQQVKRGQKLFDLDDTEVQADLAQARADLAAQDEALNVAKAGGYASQLAKANADVQKAQANRDQLRRDNEALTKLVAAKAATSAELEQNRLRLVEAEADLQASEKVKQTLEKQAELDEGRVTLQVEHSRATVRDLEDRLASAHGISPIDGTLYSFPIRQGDFVKAGDLLGELADLHKVRIRAFIDEPELGQVALNQSVDILWDAQPGQIWKGRTEVLPKQVVTRGTRSVGELICSVSNDRQDLLPNTTVDVRIQVSERTSALVIPRGAVSIDGDKRYVFRVENNRLRRVQVSVGIANPTKIEVLSGLNEGDVVALPGNVPLKQDLSVVPVQQE
jgi:HlyD family secretion protein